MQPVLTWLKNREVRERVHRASLARGSRGNEFDNTGVLSDTLKLRAERARMLGYDTHADYVLADQRA
jgi:peptidyl-dipeptidase Dcp